MTVVARYPDSTKTSLEQRLRTRARERWPQIASLQIRHRGVFSYVDATLTDATTLKLCRLRYVGSASQWQFAIYRASHDDYDESVFFTGLPVGTCQDALDTACGLYLNDPTAWTQHPTNLRARPLSLGQLGLGLRGLRLGPCLRPGPCGLRRRLAPGMFAHDRLLASEPQRATCLAWTMRLLLSEPPPASALTLVTRAARGAARRPLQIKVHRLRLPSGRLGLSVPVSQGPWSLTARRAR